MVDLLSSKRMTLTLFWLNRDKKEKTIVERYSSCTSCIINRLLNTVLCIDVTSLMNCFGLLWQIETLNIKMKIRFCGI